jgi:hypothetical protein
MPGDPPPPETLVGVGPADTIADASGAPAAPRKRPASAHGAGTRYKVGDMIGRGGNGEVVSARDEQIGRQVAI